MKVYNEHAKQFVDKLEQERLAQNAQADQAEEASVVETEADDVQPSELAFEATASEE